MYYVYILECSDKTLYCGYTVDLAARLKAHNAGKGAKYTRQRLPVKMVYDEGFETKSQALKKECQIKKLTRQQKIQLIGETSMKDFITPPNHINFLAKKLYGNAGKVLDCSIAYLQHDGGGPVESHTHAHNHLFVVVEGEAKIFIGDETVIIKANQSYLVEGCKKHSVWNNIEGTTVMVGISVEA